MQGRSKKEWSVKSKDTVWLAATLSETSSELASQHALKAQPNELLQSRTLYIRWSPSCNPAFMHICMWSWDFITNTIERWNLVRGQPRISNQLADQSTDPWVSLQTGFLNWIWDSTLEISGPIRIGQRGIAFITCIIRLRSHTRGWCWACTW